MTEELFPPKEKFLDEAKDKIPAFDENLVSLAWDFSKDAHVKVRRETGETYFAHPVGVARILLNVRCDSVTIASALLHDVVEDTDVEIKTIEEKFGHDVASLVDGVTKLARFDEPNKLGRERIRKLFVAIVKDPRVALLKLADRIHNLTTLGALPEERQRKKARESLAVFAPLAEALGLGAFQLRIQDLAFYYLEPETYRNLAKKLREKWDEFTKFGEEAVATIEDALEKEGISANVYRRQKEVYSTYRKMIDYGLELDEVYDRFGIRIIVKNVKDCYLAKYVVEQHFQEVKYDDYIGNPRGPLKYQSLHAIVRDKQNHLIEFQIRDEKMHEHAERGSAAHWIYKVGGSNPDPDLIQRINILRDTLETLIEEGDISQDEFIKSLREDGLSDYICVFSPQGKAISLPIGSTPLDFAYYIHTDLGNECRGAKVNGKLVQLDYELSDGETVEIIKGGQGPSIYWIQEGKVRSNRAIQKVRKYLRDQKRAEMIAYGRNFLDKYLKILHDFQVDIQDLVDAFAQSNILNEPTEENLFLAIAENRIKNEWRHGRALDRQLDKAIGEIAVKRRLAKNSVPFNKQIIQDLVKWFTDSNMLPIDREDSLYMEIAEGKISIKHLNQAIQELITSTSMLPDISTAQKAIENRSKSHSLFFHPAHCCYPVPGDSIVGFVTKGQGLAIHREICPEILVPERKDRILTYSWEDLGTIDGSMFSGKLLLTLASSDTKVFEKLQKAVTRAKGVVREQVAKDPSKRPLRMSLIVDVNSTKDLQSILTWLRQIEDVIEAKRALDDDII